MSRSAHHDRAAALLLVLWAIAVLSFAVLWVADLVSIELDSGAADAKRLAARQIALSGVALGMHPRVAREDVALLNQDLADGGNMRVRIRGEGARFNINRLLADQYEALLTRSRGIRVVDLSREQLRAAALLRATTGIKTPDALQVAAAIGAGCGTLLTNDRHLPSMPGLQVRQLSAYLT